MAVLTLESLSPWQSRPGCKPGVCPTSAPDYLGSQAQPLTLSDLSSLLYNKLPGPESRAPPVLTSRRPQLALTPGHGSFLFVGLLRLHLQSLIFISFAASGSSHAPKRSRSPNSLSHLDSCLWDQASWVHISHHRDVGPGAGDQSSSLDAKAHSEWAQAYTLPWISSPLFR